MPNRILTMLLAPLAPFVPEDLGRGPGRLKLFSRAGAPHDLDLTGWK